MPAAANGGGDTLDRLWQDHGDQPHSSSDDTAVLPAYHSHTCTHGKSLTQEDNGRECKKEWEERQPLVTSNADGDQVAACGQLKRYGSILGTPAHESAEDPLNDTCLLKPPDPAISPDWEINQRNGHVWDDKTDGQTNKSSSRTRTRARSTRNESTVRRLFDRVPPVRSFEHVAHDSAAAVRELGNAQNEFFEFLDTELHKVESFYKEKEDEATKRLVTLREQLHILRDRRIEQLLRARTPRPRAKPGSSIFSSNISEGITKNIQASWISSLDHAWEITVHGCADKKSRAMESQTTPRGVRPIDDCRDYTTAVREADIPHRTAKGKLKIALREYYRSLELLKSYALLNRTAFRKINKKYDKIVHAQVRLRYMSEKVEQAWFIQSDVVDGCIVAVEDLYTRYFEAGNHKVAVNKLRKAVRMHTYRGGAMFRNGLTLSAGFVFGIQGLVGAIGLLNSSDSVVALQTSYLLQIYGGYFLMLLLMLFFCMACHFWTISKVNYVFIFEFDTRDFLNWRQLYELPCFFFGLLGFYVWLNFLICVEHAIYVYLPIQLVLFTFAILLLPLPLFYSRSRSWFLTSCHGCKLSITNACSMANGTKNIGLFFCLYTRQFGNPTACSSSHSRLLGFLTTLPGIWRLVQCMRRFADTRNVFPHLVNGGKYCFTIFLYLSLSLYRIGQNDGLFALFITCAVINTLYCTVWDLAMDWSLLDAYANKQFLRKTLAYKPEWIYYAAMAIDTVLRFNWICYAIWEPTDPYNSLISFAVALSEVCRRGIWIIFRVENEHCTNVARFRAARIVPLPYVTASGSLSILEAGQTTASLDGTESSCQRPAGTEEPSKVSRDEAVLTTSHSGRTGSSATLGRRKTARNPLMRGLSRVGDLVHGAHAQDFERRRKNEDIAEYALAKDSSDDDDINPAVKSTCTSQTDSMIASQILPDPLVCSPLKDASSTDSDKKKAGKKKAIVVVDDDDS